ncbi:MAG: P-loop containing nucleoside triphosphate hydrolase protein [Monoraphidium minutum]|nr:MAG: P-loop containing nucleoside triphosphate hydrolase protein [Monoraphidium minutum]
MVKAAPKIVLRTRPTDRFPTDAFKIDQASKAVTVTLGGRSGLPGDKSGAPQQYQFKFDSILHVADQEAAFEACALDVVQGAMEGYNGTILCYGQTGAGKTFTMTGDRSAYARRGLIPRAISALMAQLRGDQGLAAWQLRIYNEAVFDLLDVTTQPHEITLHEDGRGRLAVAGLRAADVRSEQEALALFFEGEANRVIGEHQLNRESSRSHCVFTLAVSLQRGGGALDGGGGGGGGGVVSSKVCLVDLAGSERVSKTRSEGLVLREAGHINKSLHILEQVVLAASERGREHVPYRSCKLTHVLRDSIGGNCRTVLVANVWGDAAQLEETLSTCRFAARMARITCEVTRNVAVEGGARVKQLEREVSELLEELAMRDLWAGTDGGGGDDEGGGDGDGGGGAGGATSASAAALAGARARCVPYTLAQRAALLGEVERFLLASLGGGSEAGGGGEDEGAAPMEALGISSARRLREVLYACRDLYQEAVSRGHGGGGEERAPYAGVPAAEWRGGSVGASEARQPVAGGGGAGEQLQTAGDDGWQDGIGEEEGGAASQSGGAGIAPEHARPGSTPQQQAEWQRALEGVQWGAAAGPGPGSAAADASGWPAAQGGAFPPALPRSSAASDTAAGGAALGGGGAAGRAAALERYRLGPGAEKAALLNANHAKMRAAKRDARGLALALNGLKAELDAAKDAAGALRAARLERGGEEAQVAAPEELDALAAIRDLKGRYRDAHGDLQLARSEAEYAAGLVDACRQELAAEFEAWWAADAPAAAGGGGGGGGAAAAAWGAAPSRQSSAVSGCSTLLGGLPSPGALALPAPRTPQDARQQQQRSGGGGSGGGLPLASIVVAAAAAAEAQGDSAAAAYYNAQSSGMWRVQGGGGGVLRPGSAKKHRVEHGTFGVTQRSGAIGR